MGTGTLSAHFTARVFYVRTANDKRAPQNLKLRNTARDLHIIIPQALSQALTNK
jgi:hypothetical protein